MPETRLAPENSFTRQPDRAVSRQQQERRQAARSLMDPSFEIDEAVLAYVFDENGFYEQLADKLIEKTPVWRRGGRSHWLCKQLNDTAETLDPDTWAKQAGKSVRDGLRRIGLPRFMADALGAGSGVTLKIAFGTTSLGSLSKVLRILIPLVCPDFSRCPAEVEVVKVMASPVVADQLKTMTSQ